jgi:hypothetical protein
MALVGSRLSFIRSINSRLSKLFRTFEQMAFPAGLFFGRCPRIGKAVDLYGSKVARGRRITTLLSAGDFRAAQSDLDQAADGFGARGALRFCPIHDLFHQSIGYPNAVKRFGTRCRAAGLFTFNGY